MKDTTITEALAETKVLDKRIAKKREFVGQYVMRQEVVRDPLSKDGGSEEVIKRELQSIGHMEEQKIAIRRAIKAANALTEITIGGDTRTIADWLVWKKEVAPLQQNFLKQMTDHIIRTRAEQMKKPGGNVISSDSKTPETVSANLLVVHVNEKELSDKIESVETMLGTLDGQLSLKNATVVVSY